jgi:mannose/fructose/N-acetylgalactosamine-specific phosphotransferase system component IID
VYLVAIAWMYVVLMMAVAEATNSNGTVLGAIFTFLLYGLLPLSLVIYLMRTPDRRKARKAQEAAEEAAAAAARAAASNQPDASGHAPTAAQDSVITPVREKP